MAAIAVFGFTSCSSDDDNGSKSCEQLTQEYAAAFEAYSENQTEENCNDLKVVLQGLVDKDCENSANFQAQIDALGDCSEG